MKLSQRLQEHLAKYPSGPHRAAEHMMGWKVRHVLEAFGLGDFTNLVVDAAHVRARRAFTELPTVWRKITTVGPGLVDFKPDNIVAGGNFPVLEEVKEFQPYPMVKFSDMKATLSVIKRGQMFATSMEATLNDATRELSRFAVKQMRAAAQTIEKQLLVTNLQSDPTIYDGKALFHADHNNDVGTSGGYTRAGLIAAITKFMQQTDLDGEPLSVMPKYVLVPPAKLLEAMEDVASAEKIVVDQAAAASVIQGRSNELRNLNLEVLSSPRLTTTAFYVFADPASHEGHVIEFLNGREEPELLTENENTGFSFEHDAVRHKVRHVWGDAWVDYRGVVRNGV